MPETEHETDTTMRVVILAPAVKPGKIAGRDREQSRQKGAHQIGPWYGDPMATKTPRRQRRRAALAVTAVCVSTFGAGLLLNAWVVRRAAPHLVAAEQVAGDATLASSVIVVLGASVRGNGSPSRVLEDRLAAALEIAGPDQSILITGDGLSAKEIVGMRQWLVKRGVEPSRLIEDPAGLRTWDSIVRARDGCGLSDVIVVTNAFHVSRSVFLARAAGLNAVGFAARPQMNPPGWGNHVREAVARVRAVVDVTLGVGAQHPTGHGPTPKDPRRVM